MGKKKRRAAKPQVSQLKRKRGRKYTAGEWFIALLGGALIILFFGIVLTSIFGG